MPYYQPSHAEQLAHNALAIASDWGPNLDHLPLADQRGALRQDLGDLCLLMTRLNKQSAEWKIRAHELGADSSPPSSAQNLFLDAETTRLSTDTASLPLLEDANLRQRRTESLEHAIDGYRAVIVADPSHYWAHLQLGRCYLAMGRGPQAAEVLGACIAMRPEAPWGYAVRGLALSLMNRFDEAKRDLDHAVSIDPQCIAARLNRGLMYRLQGQSDLAVREFDSLIAQSPPVVEAALYRSRLYADVGNYNDALTCLDRSNVNTAEFPIAAYLLAKLALQKGDADQCLHQLDAIVHTSAERGHLLRVMASELPRTQQKRALELALMDISDATASAGASASAFADQAAVLDLLGRHDQALAAYSHAIAIAPDDCQPLINRGWCNEALNHLDQARDDFTKALQLVPNQPEAVTGLGYVDARLGRGAEAQRQASLAVLQSNGDYRILHNVACIYAQLSLTDPARAQLHQDAAIALLDQAIVKWRQGWRGRSEIELIQEEPAFPAAMRQRADFKKLTESAARSADNINPQI